MNDWKNSMYSLCILLPRGRWIGPWFYTHSSIISTMWKELFPSEHGAARQVCANHCSGCEGGDGGVSVSKLKEKSKKNIIILTSSPNLTPSLPLPGSMTRQESPTTLLHYGEHWWPLDRQPKTIYQHHQHHPTTTNIPTSPPKPRSRKGRKQHKQPQSTKGLTEAARYNRS